MQFLKLNGRYARRKDADVMTIQPATPELLALAAKMRPDWDTAALAGALAAARNAGWGWPRTFVTVTRLLARDDASPRDLLEMTRDPRRRVAVAGDAGRGAAMARQLLDHRQAGESA